MLDAPSSIGRAFQSAEDALANFVKTGKLSFGDLVTSILADLAKLAARKFILGPIANALDGVLGQIGGGGRFAGIGAAAAAAAVHHACGIVGGNAPMRAVPVMAFAIAPRMHSGGFAGLRPDEVPASLQKGEHVLSRRETAGYGAGGNVSITIQTRREAEFDLFRDGRYPTGTIPIWAADRIVRVDFSRPIRQDRCRLVTGLDHRPQLRCRHSPRRASLFLNQWRTIQRFLNQWRTMARL